LVVEAYDIDLYVIIMNHIIMAVTKVKNSPKETLETKKGKKSKKTSKTSTKKTIKTQKGLVNQAVKTGNQQTIIKINNALAKATARTTRRYAGLPKVPQYPQTPVAAPAINIQFPSLSANQDNGMREVYSMRNDIINEFRRLNPNAQFAVPAVPEAEAGEFPIAHGPPPMTEYAQSQSAVSMDIDRSNASSHRENSGAAPLGGTPPPIPHAAAEATPELSAMGSVGGASEPDIEMHSTRGHTSNASLGGGLGNTPPPIPQAAAEATPEPQIPVFGTPDPDIQMHSTDGESSTPPFSASQQASFGVVEEPEDLAREPRGSRLRGSITEQNLSRLRNALTPGDRVAEEARTRSQDRRSPHTLSAEERAELLRHADDMSDEENLRNSVTRRSRSRRRSATPQGELHDINNQHSMLVDLEHQQQVGGIDVVPMDLDVESPFPHPPRNRNMSGASTVPWDNTFPEVPAGLDMLGNASIDDYLSRAYHLFSEDSAASEGPLTPIVIPSKSSNDENVAGSSRPFREPEAGPTETRGQKLLRIQMEPPNRPNQPPSNRMIAPETQAQAPRQSGAQATKGPLQMTMGMVAKKKSTKKPRPTSSDATTVSDRPGPSTPQVLPVPSVAIAPPVSKEKKKKTLSLVEKKKPMLTECHAKMEGL